jgi:hypothetical protein
VENAADVDAEEVVTKAGINNRRCEGLARHLQQFVLAIGLVDSWLDSKGKSGGLLKR